MTAVSRRRALRWSLAAPACAVAGCAPSRTAPIGAGGEGSEKRSAPYVPFDVTWMIRPPHHRKYLGVSFAGKPVTPGFLSLWSGRAGKAPNLLSLRLPWYGSLRPDQVLAVWRQRTLPYLSWEPLGSALRDIAAGRHDGYVRHTAQTVRDLNVPLALAFAPGMNDCGRPWGTGKAAPADFVGAWRRVHDLFQDTGVSNVIWAWSPTVTRKGPARLKPYYPGDAYVDWLGLVGHCTQDGPHTFGTLFGPAVEEVRAFTRNPVLVARTAAQPGGHKSAYIEDLVHTVATHADVVGFIWFDTDDGTDWRIDSSPAALAAFRRGVANPRFGFDVRHP
ncbi:glycoside hydrolase family 26 protein [Streptomyces olivaceoviridis]|uniref:glycoside hydrolase family 26 protein n=1 Tax=Streptomyces olivaceoviridis TaxID=1921 RepID=UPI0036A47E38